MTASRFVKSLSLLLLAAFGIMLSPGPGSAQDLPPSVKQAGRELINEAVNNAVLFSSQSAIAAGTISIDRAGGRESEIDLFKLRGEKSLGESSDFAEPFLLGNFGFFKQTDSVPQFQGLEGAADFSRLSAFSVTGGFGMRIRPLQGFEITPSFSVIYTRISHDYDYNNPLSQALKPLIDRKIFNWDVNAWTYAPALRIGYSTELGRTTLAANTEYSHLMNDSFNSDSPLAQVHSSTGVLHTSASATHPLDRCLFEAPLSIKATISRGDIYGKARDGLPFNYFHEFGVDLIADLRERNAWISELSVGGSYMVGSDLEGWRVGGGFRF